MALPSWVWSNGLDFPRLYSWDQKARDELLELLKYDKSVQQRGLLNLELPDFQNLSFLDLCDSKNFEHYCKLYANIPDLKTTMDFMNIAKFPSKFFSDPLSTLSK